MGFFQSEWGVTIVIDLFLGGTGAAAFVLAMVVRFACKGRYRALRTATAWVAFCCLAASLVCLLLDVGQPLRAMWLPGSFVNTGSWMCYGAWFMFAAFASVAVVALLSTDAVAAVVGRVIPVLERSRSILCDVFGVIGAAAGFMITVYTGMLLASAQGVPFWSSLAVPLGFCSSAFFAAALVVLVVGMLRERDEVSVGLRRGLLVTTLASGVLFGASVACCLMTAAEGPVGARESVGLIVGGELSGAFWVGAVAVGLALPLALALVQLVREATHGRHAMEGSAGGPGSMAREASRLGAAALPIAAAAAALVGGLAWKYLCVAAGLHDPLLSLGVAQMRQGVTFLFF